jgi:hypothetical protein
MTSSVAMPMHDQVMLKIFFRSDLAAVSNTTSSLPLMPPVSASENRSEVTWSWRPKVIWVGAVTRPSWADAYG